MTLSIIVLSATPSINDTQHNNAQYNDNRHKDIQRTVMLSVALLSVICGESMY